MSEPTADSTQQAPTRSTRSWLPLCVVGLLHACTSASADTAGHVDDTSARSVSTLPVAAAQAPSPKLAPAPAPVAARPGSAETRRAHYDLGAHPDHAELRRGDTLIMDFGEPGDAKYTLGGWGTRIVRGAEVDGVSAAFVRGSYGDVLLSSLHDAPLVIEARVRAPRDGDVTVYLDDEVVLRTKNAPDAFATLRIDVPAGKLGKGEHMLRLRASGMGHIGTHSTGLALDWVAVGKSSVGALVPPPSKGLAPQPAMHEQPGAARLAIPAGFSLGYALRVPEHARLQGELASGSLQLTAVLDDLSSQTLGELNQPGRFDIDLAALAGKVVRLDLVATASSSDCQLTRARVTVPEVAPAQTEHKPIRNVLVYLVDTLRADHLKPFNASTRVRTPGLDSLVDHGSAVFASAHTQENWTKPSVATLLSSLLPWEHHAVTTEAVVPAGVELLPELLRGKGYHSGAFIANGYVSEKFGFKQGWSTWRNYIREGRYSRAEFIAADVLEWLDQRPQEKPFFLYVHAIDPHVPYKPTAQFLNVYDPEPYQGVVDFSDDNELLEKIKIGKIKLNGRDKVHLEALYDSEISYHDVHFSSILTALDKRGLSDDTMIVVVADHGEEFWDHGSVGHGHSVYEELLHIPMVIRVPGLTDRPVHVASSSGLVDVLPTVLEVLGQPVPANLSGRSLLPELRGQSLDAPRVTISGFMDGWRTAVIGDLKLIQRTEKRTLLHDLASDPHEQTELTAQRPITLRYLRGQLGLALASSEQARLGADGAKPVHRGETTTIDRATEAQLKALGYVGTSRR